MAPARFRLRPIGGDALYGSNVTHVLAAATTKLPNYKTTELDDLQRQNIRHLILHIHHIFVSPRL